MRTCGQELGLKKLRFQGELLFGSRSMALKGDEHYVGPTIKRSGLPAVLGFEDKVCIFEDRVRGWQLEVGLKCYHLVPDGGFGALYITLSYFELIARYRLGSIDHKKAGARFRAGFKNFATFTGFVADPNHEAVGRLLYDGARCGLYHVGMTKQKVFIGGGRAATFDFDTGTGRLVIDPGRLIDAILLHFQSYIAELMDPANANLRANFIKKFDHDILPQIS